MSATTTLAAARLVDWRFLLPSMELGHVCCGAGSPPEMVHALAAVSERVTVVRDPVQWGAVPPASADLVVLVEPSTAELVSAMRSLRPGASVYLQVRRGARGRVGGVTGVVSARRALRRAGMVNPQTYWHAPNFASCARIVPLHQRISVRHTLMRFDGVRFGRTKSWVGRALLRGGLFDWGVPCGSVVATCPADRTGSEV